MKRALDAIGSVLNSRADAGGDRQALATGGLVALQRRILREPLAPGACDELAALVIEIRGAKQLGGDGALLRTTVGCGGFFGCCPAWIASASVATALMMIDAYSL